MNHPIWEFMPSIRLELFPYSFIIILEKYYDEGLPVSIVISYYDPSWETQFLKFLDELNINLRVGQTEIIK